MNSQELINEDLCFWEAQLIDGSVYREANGFKYKDLLRATLYKFRLVYQSETVFEITVPPHLTGKNFVYRRRTSLGGGRRAFFLLGFVPDGPAFAVNIAGGDYRISEEGFVLSDPDFYPPEPMPGELNFKDWEREQKIIKVLNK